MNEEKVTLWKQRLLSFQSSGLSVTEWCKENHVAPPTFYYWKSRLEKEHDDMKPSFVEVTPTEKNVVTTKSHRVSISWNDLHFDISSKEESDLAVYFIRQLQSLCQNILARPLHISFLHVEPLISESKEKACLRRFQIVFSWIRTKMITYLFFVIKKEMQLKCSVMITMVLSSLQKNY